MGRKIFNQPGPDEAAPASQPRQGFNMGVGGSVGGLRDSLREITANAIRDIAPDRIEQDGLRDRIALEDASIDALAESIRAHGQQVPILVRPTGEPDRYRIIYGRRRLAAIRKIGGTVKAIVRTLDDEASLIAQGQENNLRLDPSFIEKALFIREMQGAGYRPQVIQDALGLSRQGVSNHKVVLDGLPDALIHVIGPAHGVGRRQWSDLASASQSLKQSAGVDIVTLARSVVADLPAETPSSDRFQAVLSAAKSTGKAPATAAPAPRKLTAPAGIDAEIQRKRNALTLSISLTKSPEFSQWLDENADEILTDLVAQWQDHHRRTT